MPTLRSRLSRLRCKFPVIPLRRLMGVLSTVVSSAMIPTSRNVITLCCRLHSAPARQPREAQMKRWEGFKHPVSTPRARLYTEIIILFEMKTVIVIDTIFIRVYRYTGNRYTPMWGITKCFPTHRLRHVYILPGPCFKGTITENIILNINWHKYKALSFVCNFVSLILD